MGPCDERPVSMPDRDTWHPQWADVAASLGLLSRLPVRVDISWAEARGAHQCWAYGVAGLILGAIGATAAWLGITAQLPALAIGFIIVATTAFVTGAMHYDGLADSLDGLWGGWTPARRLEIMKDSHIGVYGVVGLVSLLGLQAALYGQLASQDLWPIVGIMAMSRAVMVPVMTWLPNARTSGLSAQVGRPTRPTAVLAVTFGIFIAVLSGAWPAVFGAAVAAWAVGAIAMRKISGQTGDILGATQQIAEVSGLLCVIALT